MSTPLWMAIEPLSNETRLVLSVPISGTALKARLPALPAHPRAVTMLLESLSAWYRRPITAALDADALGVQHHAERWCEFLGDLPGVDVTVEWISRTEHKGDRDRFFDALGDMRSAKRLVTVASTGQR
jgi:hypothetical protein